MTRPTTPAADTPAWRALVRHPAPTLATQCELTHLSREAIDFARIEAEHAAYREALRDAGAEVTALPAIDAHPDSVFVEDAALVFDELAVLSRPGVASREDEPRAIAAHLPARAGGVVSLPPGATLDGGDVLRVGRRVLVGQGTRTNAAALVALRTLLSPFGYEVAGVEVARCLHLKTAVTALDDETLLFNPGWTDAAAFGPGWRLLHTAPGEDFAANVLRMGTTLVVNGAHPRTADRVATHAAMHGLRVRPVAMVEFGKAEAGLTCLSIVYPG